MINYQAAMIFTWFVKQVTEVQHKGDEDKSKRSASRAVQTAGKEHFTKLIANTMGKVQVWKKVKERLFIRTNGFCFVYILLYLTPETSDDKWVKAYRCSVLKS